MLLPVVPRQMMAWRDAYAFFPILARDIDAPALLGPWAPDAPSGSPGSPHVSRTYYHHAAAPVVYKAMSRITIWAWHADRMVAVPSVELAKTGLSGDEAVAEHLSRGGGARLVRQPGLEQDFKRLSSWPSSRYDVLAHLVARLPDFDKQPRTILRRLPPMHILAMYWCANVTDEWLENVRRKQRSRSDENPGWRGRALPGSVAKPQFRR